MCLLRGVAVRQERAAWLVMGVGLLAWAGGDITWTLLLANDPDPPYPSVSDLLYLMFYPASYVRCCCLARSRTDSFRTSLWLDGAVAGLTVAALIATFAFEPILQATSGTTAEIVVNLAYPVGDLLLLGLVVAVFGGSGWRLDPVWLLLGGGLALSAIADTVYLVQTANDTYHEGTLLDTLWPASVFLVALAAWQPTRRRVALHDWLIMGVPVGCGVDCGAAARVRPLRALQHPRREPGGLGAAARARAHGARLPRDPAHAGPEPRRGAHGLAHGPPEPAQPARGPGGPARRSRPGRAARRCCCSTSTASRSTTTPSAIPPATACSCGWPRGWPMRSAPPATRTGWAATSSACSPARAATASTRSSRPAPRRSGSAARASR